MRFIFTFMFLYTYALHRASLTIEERMMLSELWVHECKRLGMKTVVHVSHMCLRTARDLAIHAAKIGADSIGMYPPFAPESPPTLAAVAQSIDFATRDAGLPLYVMSALPPCIFVTSYACTITTSPPSLEFSSTSATLSNIPQRTPCCRV